MNEYCIYPVYCQLKIYNVYVDNNSTTNSSYFINNGTTWDDTIIKNLTLDLSNQSFSWIVLWTTNTDWNIIVDWVHVIWWWSSCYSCIDINWWTNISNIKFTWTFSTSTSWIIVLSKCNASKIYYYWTSNSFINCSWTWWNLSQVYWDNSAWDLDVSIGWSDWIVSDINLTEWWSEFKINSNNVRCSNIYVAWTVVIQWDSCILDSCYSVQWITIWSWYDNNIISNCIDEIGWINITWDNNSIIGCRCWSSWWWSSATVTVNAAADKTIISWTRTDAAISDSGTNTTTSWNIVY